MEKINNESIISTLFILGFDRVDTILYSNILNEIIRNKNFKMVCTEETNIFKKFIDYNGIRYKIKDDYNINSEVINMNGKKYTLKEILPVNKELEKFLKTLNYEEIIKRKISILGNNNMIQLDYLFSEKEKKIIEKLYEKPKIKMIKIDD